MQQKKGGIEGKGKASACFFSLVFAQTIKNPAHYFSSASTCHLSLKYVFPLSRVVERN